jgi:hypothetical protein
MMPPWKLSSPMFKKTFRDYEKKNKPAWLR